MQETCAFAPHISDTFPLSFPFLAVPALHKVVVPFSNHSARPHTPTYPSTWLLPSCNRKNQYDAPQYECTPINLPNLHQHLFQCQTRSPQGQIWAPLIQMSLAVSWRVYGDFILGHVRPTQFVDFLDFVKIDQSLVLLEEYQDLGPWITQPHHVSYSWDWRTK
jgi:hypothetical protein